MFRPSYSARPLKILVLRVPNHPSQEQSALPARSESALSPLFCCAVQVGMLGVIVSAIMVIMIGYLMVGISGYLAFPTTVEGNVLNSFTRGDIIMQVGHTLHADSMLSFKMGSAFTFLQVLVNSVKAVRPRAECARAKHALRTWTLEHFDSLWLAK